MNINQRHEVLSTTIGTTEEEDHSFQRTKVLLPLVLILFPLLSGLEMATYWAFNFKVFTLRLFPPIFTSDCCRSTPGKRSSQRRKSSPSQSR